MISDSGNQFYLVRQFDQVIIGPQSECLGLGVRFLFAREDNQGDITCLLIGTEELYQGQAINLGHNQVQ